MCHTPIISFTGNQTLHIMRSSYKKVIRTSILSYKDYHLNRAVFHSRHHHQQIMGRNGHGCPLRRVCLSPWTRSVRLATSVWESCRDQSSQVASHYAGQCLLALIKIYGLIVNNNRRRGFNRSICCCTVLTSRL